MSMRKKCTTFLIVAVSSALLASCASNQSGNAKAAASRPMLIASAETFSAADHYARRYASSATQIQSDGKHHFVSCEPLCPGATPKTPISKVMATVARRALHNAQGKSIRASTASPAAAKDSTTVPSAVAAAEHQQRNCEVDHDSEH